MSRYTDDWTRPDFREVAEIEIEAAEQHRRSIEAHIEWRASNPLLAAIEDAKSLAAFRAIEGDPHAVKPF